jgi:hypothetical protein
MKFNTDFYVIKHIITNMNRNVHKLFYASFTLQQKGEKIYDNIRLPIYISLFIIFTVYNASPILRQNFSDIWP